MSSLSFRRLLLLTVLATAAPMAVAQSQDRRPGQMPAAVEPGRPFPPLAAAAQQRLDQLLLKWQTESQATKLLSCDFVRWHFDTRSAPAGTYATRAEGSIKYAAPDKGLFRVDSLKMFQGMNPDGQSTYAADPKNPGEYWVCNGAELLEFDRAKKECNVQTIPEQHRGKKIFQSPLPFVFNLDADEIQRRYWLRELPPPADQTDIYLIEAWPKTQEDRSQYRFVQILIGAKTFLPQQIVIYAPNFDPKTAPVWDHYEFKSVSRNGAVDKLQQFTDSFIKTRPPSDWKVIRNSFMAPEQAAAPTSQLVR